MKKYILLLLVAFVYGRLAYSQCAGNALQFDGVNDHVNVGNSASLVFTSQFTAEAWVYPTGIGSGGSGGLGGIIINKEGEYEIARWGDGFIYFAVANASPGWVWVNTGYFLNLNTWTHIAFVANSSSIKLYADGVQVYSTVVSGAIGDADISSNEFHIGNRQFQGGIQHFQGIIDEVRMWDAALNQATILQWKNKSVAASHPDYANLKGYWKFDEVIGTNASDASGVGNNGILTNGPAWINSTVNLNYAPVINSLSPLSGPVGTSVTITGSNFDLVAVNNTVNIGNVKATVTSASSTSLSFTVPAGITNQPVSVTNACGLTALSKLSFNPAFVCTGNINNATLAPAQLFTSTQQYAYSTVAGDLDGDGKPEMVIVHHYGHIGVYRNTSTPGIINAATYAAPFTIVDGSIAGVKLGDMDGDGKQDIVAVSNGSGSVLIYRNTSTPGTLSFAAAVTLPTGTNGKDAAITDIDKDGKLDLACTPNAYGVTPGNLTLIKNNSSPGTLSFASFVTLTPPPVGNFAYFQARIEAGDLDGDGFPELAFSTYNTQNVYVYKNNAQQGTISASSFAAYTTIPVGNTPLTSVIADLDNDGKPELIAGGYSSLSVLKNNSVPGIISFAPKVDFASGYTANDIQIGDMNGDGKPDICFWGLAIMQNNTVTGVINSSSFGTPVSYSLVYPGGTFYSGMQNLAIADVDGDGQPDLIATGYNMTNANSAISVFRNKTGSPISQNIAAGGPTTFCIGGNVVLSVPNVAGVNYQWKLNGVNTGSNSNSLTATQGGTYLVEMSNSCGTTNSSSINVTVETAAPNVQAISPAGPISLCSFSSASLSVPLQSGVTFQWKNNGTNTGTNSAGLTVYGAGNYTVNITNTCGTTASANTVVVNSNVAEITSFSPATGAAGSTVIINGNNFDPVASNNKVYFGAVKAAVNSATSTSLNVTVPPGATYDFISVVGACGYIGYSKQKFNPGFGCGGSVATAFSTGTNFTSTTPFNLRSISTADMDGDGKPDVLLSDYNYNSSPGGKISIYRNTATPGVVDNTSLASPVNVSIAPNSSGAFKTADLNNDGRPDLVVASYAYPSISVFQNNSTSGSIAMGPRIDLSTDYNPNGIALNDFDGDGRTDIIISYSTRSYISIFRNISTTSTLSFATRIDVSPGMSSAYDLSDGDIDGDGKADLVLVSGQLTHVFILRNISVQGSILFAPTVSFPIGGQAGGIQLADIDNDGKLDAVTSNINSNTGVILKNTSTAGAVSFASAVSFAIGSGNNFYRAIGVGDINGDGKVDLAYPNYYANTVSIVSNNSAGSIALSSASAISVLGSPGGTVLSDIDLDGKPDLITLGISNTYFSIFRNNSILANATVSPAGSVSVCPGGSIALTASAGVSYLWSNGATTQSISVSDAGSYSVAVIDANGCTATSPATVVSLYPAAATPTISVTGSLSFCPGGSVILSSSAGNAYLWSNGAITQSITVNQGGNYTVTVTNASGCSATSAPTSVTVIDNSAPVPNIATLPTITGQCSATVTAPTATDNCAGQVTATTNDPVSYSLQGTYTVHWTYSDGNGNTSTQNQTVIVNDDIAPVPNTATLPTITGQCSATVTAPTATDNCAGTVTATTNDPLSYTAQGTYTVHWTYDDGNGNTSTQNQTVIVNDDIAPVPNVMTLPTITGQCSATVTAPTALDNCAGTVTATTNDPTSYSLQGAYTVHWTYDDGNGNTSTQNQTVIVNDDIAPVPNVATLATVSGQCSATVTAPTATDNCAGTVTATTNDPTSYSLQGTYTVHWVYDDGHGNTSTQNQTVVVNDDIAPVPNVVTLPTITGQCSATVTAPTATDNCAGTVTATTNDPLSYSLQGTYTVHWTYDDGHGNTSTQNQTVTVNDISFPTFNSCPGNIFLSACVSTATWTEPTASDNCPGVTVVRTAGPAPGSTFLNGTTTTITYTATDAAGNQTNCSFSVTRAAALSASSSASAISCNGGTSTVTINASGGTAPYTGTGTFTRTAGTYSFTVTDADGCTATTSVTIGQPGLLTATSSATAITCNGGTSTVTVNASGGTAPYTGTGTFTRTAGTYSFTVTDANGCSTITTVNITQPAALTATCTNNNGVLYYGYTGDQTSTITVKPSGGVGPYTVSITMSRPLRCNVVNSSGDEIWTPGTNTASSSNIVCPSSGAATLFPVSTSTHTINSVTGYSINVTLMQDAVFTATITDENGCTTTYTTSIHAEDVRCFAGNSGNAKITICHQTGSNSKPCVKICVDESALADHFAHGDFLGNCPSNCVAPNGGNGMITSQTVETNPSDSLQIKTWPNPSENYFTLQVKGKFNESVIVRVMDINGKQLYINRGPVSKLYQFGEMFTSGIYLVEVLQGKNKVFTKLVKQ
jgi:Concanavalin A-like lectin/glucanases superfamily/FG-GAP-like repeat/HYR domain/IPT/TIG domain/Secretion system C-terminal sorting domain